jgi:hypothetical protein
MYVRLVQVMPGLAKLGQVNYVYARLRQFSSRYAMLFHVSPG